MMREMDLSRVRQALWEIDRLTTLYWICKETESFEPEKVDGTDGLLILEIERRVDELKAAIPAA